MERIEEILDGVKTMGIGGHVRPDGDCVGSCMALYLYIKKWYPKIHADIYLEKPKPVFGHIACMDEVKYEAGEEKEYDLFVTCDVSASARTYHWSVSIGSITTTPRSPYGTVRS